MFDFKAGAVRRPPRLLSRFEANCFLGVLAVAALTIFGWPIWSLLGGHHRAHPIGTGEAPAHFEDMSAIYRPRILSAFPIEPANELFFIGLIDDFGDRYRQATTIADQVGAQDQLSHMICTKIRSAYRHSNPWVGVVDATYLVGGNRATLTISIAHNITISTGNGADAKLLIEPQTEAFSALSQLRPGDPIIFRPVFKFGARNVCFVTANTSVQSAMSAPQWLASFEMIQAVK